MRMFGGVRGSHVTTGFSILLILMLIVTTLPSILPGVAAQDENPLIDDGADSQHTEDAANPGEGMSDPVNPGTENATPVVDEPISDTEKIPVEGILDPINQTPIAVDDYYSVEVGGTLEVAGPGILTNDIDADGNPLTATKATDPANGTVEIHLDGSFTYVHDGSETLSDSFAYVATGKTGESNSATVTIEITSEADTTSNLTGQSEPDKMVISVTPDKNAQFASSSNKLRLSIPEGAISEDAQFEIVEHGHRGPKGGGMLNVFELNAYAKTDNVEYARKIERFNKDLTITIQHDPADLVGFDTTSLKLCYFNEERSTWIPLPSQYDPETRILTATTDHFSYVGEIANPAISGPGKVMAAEVGLHSGASMFNYPIEVPPGAGGFQPSINLTYNSGSVDNMKNKRDVGSWVGIGWDLSFGSVTEYDETDTNILMLNGVSYDLVHVDGNEYRTVPDNFAKVIKDGWQWEVWDTDGIYYRFGDRQFAYSGYGIQRCDLDRIQPANSDNVINISYVTTSWIGQRSAHPSQVSYNGGRVTINFESSTVVDPEWGPLRPDNPKGTPQNGPPWIIDNRQLDAIKIYVDGGLTKEYRFDYTTTPCEHSGYYGGIYFAGTHVLDSITQFDGNGVSLPSTTFTYQNRNTRMHDIGGDYGGNPGNPAQFQWPHLIEIDNGYGGGVTFSYQEMPQWSAYLYNIWTRQIVTQKTINPGIGTTQSIVYEYDSLVPYYEDHPHYVHRNKGWDSLYRGFPKVTERIAGNSTVHYFYTTGSLKDEYLSGKEYCTEWHEGTESSGNLLRTQDNTWDYSNTAHGFARLIREGEWGADPYFYVKDVAVGSDGMIYYNGYNYGGHYLWGLNDMYEIVQTFNNFVGDKLATDTQGNLYYTWQNRIIQFNGGTVKVSNLDHCTDFALDSSGNFYTVEGPSPFWGVLYGGSHVNKYDSSGSFVSQIYSGNVAAVDVDSDDNVYVLHYDGWFQGGYYYSGGVSKLNASGNPLSSNPYPFTGTDYPRDLSVDVDGHYYVLHNNDRNIYHYNDSGEFVGTFGGFVTDYPRHLDTSPSGELHVAQHDQGSILVHTTEGPSMFGRPYHVYLNEIETIEDPDGTSPQTARITYEYDDYGNVVNEYHHGDVSDDCNSPEGCDDREIIREFHPNTGNNILGRIASETVFDSDANPQSIAKYYYDNGNWADPPSAGNLTRIETYKDASNSVSSYFTYDNYGNVLTEQDPEGNIWTTVWETTYHTFPQTISAPVSGHTESYTFDPGTGNILSRTDVNNQTASYEYDTFGRLTKVIKPGDSSESPSAEYQYNNWGQQGEQHLKSLAKVGEGNYLWSSQYFDGLGRIIQTHSTGTPTNTIISSTTVYDNRGLVDKAYIAQSKPSTQINGYVIPEAGWKYSTSQHDALGRVVESTAVDGSIVSYDYDTPWEQTVTNPLNVNKRYEYDAFGRLVQVDEIDPGDTQNPYETTYSYDILGNLVQVEDALGNVTQMEYDWLSRKTWMSDPDMGEWYYRYDDSGNLNCQIDAKGQAINMYYDELNRLTGKTYDEGPVNPATYQRPVDPGAGNYDVEFTYDDTTSGNQGIGRRTGMTGAAGTTSYRYNERGLLTEEDRILNGTDYTTGFQYDAGDRLSSITYPTGEIVTQTYDERSMPDGLAGSAAGTLVSDVNYNYYGQITRIDLGNNASTSYSYWGLDQGNGIEQFGKLWQITTIDSNMTTIQNVQHSWDAMGNLDERVDTLVGETESFEYDFLDRLTYVMLTGGSTPYSKTWEYNEIGNIIQTNGQTYVYGSKPHAVASVGAQSYTYDANGNMTQRGDQVIQWDVENKPIEITQPGAGGGAGNGYFEDFEDELGAEWSTYRSNGTYGRNECSTYSSHEGTYGWRMDVTTNGNYNLNELILRVDVNGATYLNLDFATREYNDESNTLASSFSGHSNGDGIAVSSDGTNWVRLWQYPASVSTWTEYTDLDIDSLISIDGDVYIKFQQYDNYAMSTDGIMWDAINLDSDGVIMPFGSVGGGQSTSTFAEGFEDELGAEWATYQSDGTYGRNERSTYSSHEGDYGWRMDVTTNGYYNLNELILHVYVNDATYLNLDFATIEYNDEQNTLASSFSGHYNGDGIAVSNDGTNWVRLWQYPASVSTFTEYTDLDIDSLISIDGDVYIKFQQYDNYAMGTDGIMWDAINLDSDGMITPFGSVGGGQSISTFVYDGDGNRVMKTENGETVLYVNQYYEVNITTSVDTSHYYLGGRQVACNKGDTLTYVHQDHLSGTSLTTNDSGILQSTVKYFPYGETRNQTGTLTTDKMFTGQRLDQTGLYFYNARYYDSSLRRFISADTIVPDPYNPQSLNRYSYCLNNPLKYIDPSGHCFILDPGTQKSLANMAALAAGASLDEIPYPDAYYRGGAIIEPDNPANGDDSPVTKPAAGGAGNVSIIPGINIPPDSQWSGSIVEAGEWKANGSTSGEFSAVAEWTELDDGKTVVGFVTIRYGNNMINNCGVTGKAIAHLPGDEHIVCRNWTAKSFDEPIAPALNQDNFVRERQIQSIFILTGTDPIDNSWCMTVSLSAWGCGQLPNKKSLNPVAVDREAIIHPGPCMKD